MSNKLYKYILPDFIQNEELGNEIIKLKSCGYTHNEIAAVMQCSPCTIYAFLKEKGLTKTISTEGRKQSGKNPDIEEIIKKDDEADKRNYAHLVVKHPCPKPDNFYVVRQYGKAPYIASDITDVFMWASEYGEEVRFKC